MTYSCFDSPVKMSVFTYICISVLIILSKPRIFFNQEGDLKHFGCEQDATLFTLPVCLYWLAVIITFCFEFIHLKNFV